MNKRLKKYVDEKTAVKTKADEILATAEKDNDRQLTEEEQTEFDALVSKAKEMDMKITREQEYEALISTLPPMQTINSDDIMTNPLALQAKPKSEPQLKYPHKLRAFKDAKAAYRFGQFLRGAAGIPGAVDFCHKNDIPLAIVAERTNAEGGALVPEEFVPTLIDIVTEYGVFRKEAEVVPMSSDVRTQPRRVGGTTAYFVAEYAAGTVSSPTFDNVSLTARDLMILTLVTNDVMADAVINIADRFAIEAGRAFAYKEDLCGFIGTGTSTYGGIEGVAAKLKTINGTDTGGGLVAYGTGYAWSNIAIADDLIPLMSILPPYADQNAKWYCSRKFYYQVLVKLESAAGGVTIAELQAGARTPKFMGYPVVFSEAMPTAAATSTVQLLFGDLYMAAQFGDRQQLSIAMNPAAVIGSVSAFERNSIGLRAVERFDINVHDIGSSTAAGCVVGLISHSA